jgi:RND family efflux transporter MFP subunit
MNMKMEPMDRQIGLMACKRQTYNLLTLALIFAFLTLSCGKPADTPSGNGRRGGTTARAAVQIQTAPVQRISIERQVDVSGTLTSTDQAKVSSEVAGVVQQVLFELGTDVQPGQVLVKLEPTELQLALQRAESALRQTEAQLGIDEVKIKEPPPDEEISSIRTALANRDDARAQLARARRLMSQKLLPQADLDTAETKVKVMEANYQAAIENVQALKASLQDRRASLDLAKKKLNDATIRSSVGGQVSEKLVQPGEYIRENTPVVSIVRMSPLKLKTAVQEKNAGAIHQNQPVQFQVESFPGITFSGKVAYISPAVDQTTRTFAVEILVENRDRRLKPGFFAQGFIQTKIDENVMAVPEEAISQLAGVSSIFAIVDNKVHQVTITKGSNKGKLVEIVSGLNGDEVLAVTNINQLANGVAVEVISGSAAAAQTEKSPSTTPVSLEGGSRQ